MHGDINKSAPAGRQEPVEAVSGNVGLDSDNTPSDNTKQDNIIRVDHSRENPYLQFCRKTIRDPDLDLEAKGLLAFLLDKPKDWRIRPESLAKELRVSRDTIYRILVRLDRAGYLYREIQRRNKDGKFQSGARYVVFEDKDYRREWADRQRFKVDGKLHGVEVPF